MSREVQRGGTLVKCDEEGCTEEVWFSVLQSADVDARLTPIEEGGSGWTKDGGDKCPAHGE